MAIKKHINDFRFEIIITVVWTLVTVFSASGLLGYLDGRGLLKIGRIMEIVLFCFTISLGILFSILIVIRATAKANMKSTRQAKVVFAFAFFNAIMPPTVHLLSGPISLRFCEGFAVYAKGRTDFSSIRSWVQSLAGKEILGGFVDPYRWPESVNQLSPDFVKVLGRGTIEMTWGEDIIAWAIVVGPEDAIPPPLGDREVRRTLVEGAYLWYQK